MSGERRLNTNHSASIVCVNPVLNRALTALPDFSRPARQRWESIPADIRQRLLANVWCGQCRHEVTITNFTGTIKGGDLLLLGKCAECHGDVARVIEGS